MKKIFTTAALTLSLIPFFANAANALENLIPNRIQTGTCGKAPNPPQSAFCTCFLTQAAAACNASGKFPKNMCQPSYILTSMKAVSDYAAFCQKYSTLGLIPPGVDLQECREDIEYVHKHC